MAFLLFPAHPQGIDYYLGQLHLLDLEIANFLGQFRRRRSAWIYDHRIRDRQWRVARGLCQQCPFEWREYSLLERGLRVSMVFSLSGEKSASGRMGRTSQSFGRLSDYLWVGRNRSIRRSRSGRSVWSTSRMTSCERWTVVVFGYWTPASSSSRKVASWRVDFGSLWIFGSERRLTFGFCRMGSLHVRGTLCFCLIWICFHSTLRNADCLSLTQF